MKLHWAGRGKGKTTAMLAWLAANPTSVLLVVNEPEAVRLRRFLPPEQGQRIMRAQRGCLRGQPGPAAFDNLDWYLNEWFGGPIDLATVSEYEDEWIPYWKARMTGNPEHWDHP